MKGSGVKIKWTPFALHCLNEIHDYVLFREQDIDLADKLIEGIFSKLDQLESAPESGQIEPLLNEIGQTSRYLIKFNYKIIYEFDQQSSSVIVTDGFNTRQDPGKLERSFNP